MPTFQGSGHLSQESGLTGHGQIISFRNNACHRIVLAGKYTGSRLLSKIRSKILLQKVELASL